MQTDRYNIPRTDLFPLYLVSLRQTYCSKRLDQILLEHRNVSLYSVLGLEKIWNNVRKI